jgi:hypothetical protein
MSPLTAAPEVSARHIGIDEILSYSSRWDKRIAADLVAEMEILSADKLTTLPEVRHILAVKGYQELRRKIESQIDGKSGPAALRAMADAMRNYALERPGLSSATFRGGTSEAPDLRLAVAELTRVALHVFKEVDLQGEQAEQALRILRCLVRGFVISEMAATFFAEPSESQRTFDLGIEVFILGLPALAR